MDFPINIEQWRLIDGYDNYEISSHGRVRNNKTSRIRKFSSDTYGYRLMVLSKNGKTETYKVHQLVGFAFLEKKEGDTEIDHIDHDRQNNTINNLRWTTHSGNMRNRTKQKTNTSGHQGVHFDKQGFWVATWCDEK